MAELAKLELAQVNGGGFQEERGGLSAARVVHPAQAKLLEEIQNVALDYQLQVQKQQLLPDAADSKTNASVYREVAVEVRLRGDQTTLLGWLASLQSPEKFQAIKQLELEIDAKAKEKTPQALCNLVLARWFKPENGFQP